MVLKALWLAWLEQRCTASAIIIFSLDVLAKIVETLQELFDGN